MLVAASASIWTALVIGISIGGGIGLIIFVVLKRLLDQRTWSLRIVLLDIAAGVLGFLAEGYWLASKGTYLAERFKNGKLVSLTTDFPSMTRVLLMSCAVSAVTALVIHVVARTLTRGSRSAAGTAQNTEGRNDNDRSGSTV